MSRTLVAFLASLALASAVDHPPVSCDEADSGSLCKRVVDQLIAGDWFRTELPCTTCTEGMITCGMWQAPNFAPGIYSSDICAQALAMALPAFGFTTLSVDPGPWAGYPATGCMVPGASPCPLVLTSVLDAIAAQPSGPMSF